MTTEDQNTENTEQKPADTNVEETIVQDEILQQDKPEEVKPVVEEVVQPVVEEKPVEVVKPTAAPRVEQRAVQDNTKTAKQNFTNIDDYITSLKETGTVSQKNLIAALEKYLEDMRPRKPILSEKGAEFQYQFWKTLQAVAEHSSNEEFKSLWTIILAYFDKYQEEAFHYRYVNRFSEYWSHDVDELSAYQRLINLIKLTAVPKERALGLKQINLNLSLGLVFSEQARQKITNFYN